MIFHKPHITMCKNRSCFDLYLDFIYISQLYFNLLPKTWLVISRKTTSNSMIHCNCFRLKLVKFRMFPFSLLLGILSVGLTYIILWHWGRVVKLSDLDQFYCVLWDIYYCLWFWEMLPPISVEKTDVLLVSFRPWPLSFY